MRTFDFTPYRRSMIGFDRLFDILESAGRSEVAENYPPFDLERLSEDKYRITLAVAGFGRDDIELTAHQNLLIVAGSKREKGEDSGYLHRGIGTRAFERRFQLADFIKVGHADMADGLLTIELEREIPEAMRPRKVEIGGATVHQIADRGPQDASSSDEGTHRTNAA